MEGQGKNGRDAVDGANHLVGHPTLVVTRYMATATPCGDHSTEAANGTVSHSGRRGAITQPLACGSADR